MEQNLSVSTPLFQIGFKEQVLEGLEQLKTQIATEIILDVLAGEASPFYRHLLPVRSAVQ